MTEKEQLSEEVVRKTINSYVAKNLPSSQYIKIRDKKVIHDSVHGTGIFYPHEIAFLDLPIIQRLRRISQTDVASLVFPAGNHNRFEHTVGVTIVAGKMVESLFIKNCISSEEREYILFNCRIAAILHDCGHGPFSHLTEQIYASELEKLRSENKILKGASAHEMLSYFIATSEPLKKFNEQTIKGVYNIEIDLDFVGNMIVGYIDREDETSKKFGFVVELINGAFDADKLDYILRDAHSTGIHMALDLPRLFYTLDVIDDEEGVKRLALNISGVTTLEEIIFNKMILISTIYHHQKVRAAGCMLRSIIEASGIFKNALDYLEYTDDMIYCLNSDNEYIKEQLVNMKNRILPKRALCFSSHTIENTAVLKDIISFLEDKDTRQNIILNIVKYVKDVFKHEVKENEIFIDVPKPPTFKEATQCLIKSEGSKNNYILLQTVFPTDAWVRSFSENKWRGFVYAMPEKCKYVTKASKHVFEEVFKVKFNKFAEELCKLDEEIESTTL